MQKIQDTNKTGAVMRSGMLAMRKKEENLLVGVSFKDKIRIDEIRRRCGGKLNCKKG